MRIEALVSLRGIPAGGLTPAGGFASVDDVQGSVLVRLGFAREVPVGDAEPAQTSTLTPEPAKAPKPEKVPETPPPPPPPPAGEEHHADLAEALELIGEDDLETEGDRAGKPKLDAVAAVLGHEVSADVVDAAWAAREHGG